MKKMSTNSENKPLLLNGSDNIGKQEDGKVTGNDKSNNVINITVRIIVLVMFVIALDIGGTVVDQYIYKWLQHNSGSNTTVSNSTSTKTNSSSLNPCGGNISAKSEDKDQSEAANWMFYFTLAENGVAIPFILIYGVYSDYIGRKPLIILSCVSNCIQHAIIAFMVHRNLPLVYFLIPYTLGGLCGGHYTFFLSMMASVADKTHHDHRRTFGIVLIQTIMGVGYGAGQLVTGYLIKNYHYFLPIVAASGAFGVCVLLVIFGMSDTRERKSANNLTITKYLQIIFGLFFSKRYIIEGSLFIFNMTMFSYFIVLFSAASQPNINLLYELRSPFCWSSEEIGWYGFGSYLVKYILGALTVKGLQQCVSDSTIIILSLVSVTAYCVISALANTSLLLYISSAAGFLSIVSIPLLQGFSSNMIDPEKQGAVFGNIYVLDNVCKMSGKSVLQLYSRTQTFMAGLSYLVMAAMYLLAILVFVSVLYSKHKGEKRKNVEAN